MTNGSLGKFKTSEELLDAYTALEREFTKRCQMLKRLREEKEYENDGGNVGKEPVANEGIAANSPNSDNAYSAPDAEEKEENKGETTQILAQTSDGSNDSGDKAAAERIRTDVPEDIPHKAPPEANTGVVVAAAVYDPAGGEDTAGITETPAAVLETIANNAALYAEALSALPEVMDACICRYKQKLMDSRFPSRTAGLPVITPVMRPKTLKEAKMLVDELILE